MSPDVKEEMQNALRGCLEIPLYLKIGATRFSGSVDAFKRSFVIPALIIPLVALTIPNPPLYADKSVAWTIGLFCIQEIFAILFFAGILSFYKNKNVTSGQFLKCLTAYNWISIPAYVVNIPLILLAVIGVHTWDDVSAMMVLTALYTYSYLAFMISKILGTTWYVGLAFAMADLMMGAVIDNVTTFTMLKLF